MSQKIYYFIFGIIGIVLIILVFFYYNSGITIVANPAIAKVSIDNKTFQSGKKIKLKPGDYKIKVELEDYIPYRKILNVGFASFKSVAINLRLLPIPEKAVSKDAKFAVLSEDKKSLYFLSNAGKTLYTIHDIGIKDLQIEAISPDFFSNVTDIIWSPDRQLAIIKQNNKTSLYDFKRYDLLHQEITPFKDGIKDIVWSADSQNLIYYFGPKEGETTLIKASKTNTDIERIYNFKDTDIRNPQIDWSPDMLDVLLVANKKLYIFNLYDKKLIEISVDTDVLEARFTPDNNILYISLESAYISNKTGDKQEKLDFVTTLDKLTFFTDKQIVLTQKQQDNNHLFYLYDLENNSKTELVYNKKQQVNPINAILTADQENLYFESKGYLYRMKVDTLEY